MCNQKVVGLHLVFVIFIYYYYAVFYNFFIFIYIIFCWFSIKKLSVLQNCKNSGLFLFFYLEYSKVHPRTIGHEGPVGSRVIAALFL